MTVINSAIPYNDRILVIDDDPDIRSTFTMVLTKRMNSNGGGAMSDLSALLGDDQDSDPAAISPPTFAVESAGQGEEGFELVMQANEAGHPYAVVFIDMRMPPGWDGIKTAREIRRICPLTEIVVVTAFSDASLRDIVEKVGFTDRLLYLKKPFEREEICQLADSLVMRWNLEHRLTCFMHILEEVLEQLVEAAFADEPSDMPLFLKKVLDRLGALIGTEDIFLAETDGQKIVKRLGLGRFSNGMGKPEAINPLVSEALARHKTNTVFTIDEFLVMSISSRCNPCLVIGLKPGRQVEGVDDVLEMLARNIGRVYDVAFKIVSLRKG